MYSPSVFSCVMVVMTNSLIVFADTIKSHTIKFLLLTIIVITSINIKFLSIALKLFVSNTSLAQSSWHQVPQHYHETFWHQVSHHHYYHCYHDHYHHYYYQHLETSFSRYGRTFDFVWFNPLVCQGQHFFFLRVD